MAKLVKVAVAVAVITNNKSEVLISLRPKDVHQGGLWEFPGGKLEDNESVIDALKREINEELNIEIQTTSVFKKIRYQYPDKTVELDILRVESFSGVPVGVEGQKIKWQKISELKTLDFPLANRPIIHALQLTDKYMITGAFETPDDFKSKLQASLIKGIRLVQLRCKNISTEEYLQLAEISMALCKQYSAVLLLNTNTEVFLKSHANGLHLSSQMLNALHSRPIPDDSLLSVSCHNSAEIKKAKKLKADIILLSPVKETRSHPGVKGIGWHKFTEMAIDIEVPVYALGGMTKNDLNEAKHCGAQGVAAISNFWG